MTKFTFLSEQEITVIYEADSVDDLKDRFTPDAVKDLVELPDNAKEGNLFDGTTLSEKKTAKDKRTAEAKKLDDDFEALTTVDEKWAFAKAVVNKVTNVSLETQYKDDAAGLEAIRVEFYKDNS
tara:strand:- start:68 stop:439 length:372 start_codon:yes stop_codon:yes gene_type:complete